MASSSIAILLHFILVSSLVTSTIKLQGYSCVLTSTSIYGGKLRMYAKAHILTSTLLVITQSVIMCFTITTCTLGTPHHIVGSYPRPRHPIPQRVCLSCCCTLQGWVMEGFPKTRLQVRLIRGQCTQPHSMCQIYFISSASHVSYKTFVSSLTLLVLYITCTLTMLFPLTSFNIVTWSCRSKGNIAS